MTDVTDQATDTALGAEHDDTTRVAEPGEETTRAMAQAGRANLSPLPEHLTQPWRRHDFVWLFDVTMGNPNGDPDNDGRPRIDPEDRYGIVTGVRLRRALRNWVSLFSRFEEPARRDRLKIHIEHGAILNDNIRGSYEDIGLATGQRATRNISNADVRRQIGDLAAAGLLPDSFTFEPGENADGASLTYSGELAHRELKAVLDDLGDAIAPGTRRFVDNLAKEARSPEKTRDRADAARRQMDVNYYDVRTFGAVMSTGLDADRETGPVQIPDCRSVDPIEIMDLAITRMAVTREEDAEKERTIGRRYIVPYALYRAPGFFSPFYAERTGLTSYDLEVFWNSLRDPWSIERSYARGLMTTVRLHIFTHDHPMGNAPAHELLARVRASLKPDAEVPEGIDDYEISVDLEGLPAGITHHRLF